MNNESAIFNGLSDLIRNNVLGPIATYLQNRQQQGPITEDELANVLKLPASSTPPPAQSQASSSAPAGFPPMNGMPSGLVGFGGMPMQMNNGNKKSRTKNPTEAPPDNERCQYRFVRGQNKGLQCTNRKDPGTPFCKSCGKKKTAQNQLQNGTVSGGGSSMPNTSMPSNMPNNLPGMPGGMNPMMQQQQPMQAPTQPDRKQINVQQIGPGLYRETKYGLALKTGTNPNEFICCGVMNNPQNPNDISKLTQEHMDYCKQTNLDYVDPDKSNGTPQQSSTPTGQQQQGMPGLPSMSNSGQQQQGMPGLPSMSNSGQQQQGMPGLPSMSNSGQQQQGMPGLPSMSNSGQQQQQNMPGLPSMSNYGQQQQQGSNQNTPQGLPQVPAVGSSSNYPAVTDTSNPDDPTDDAGDE